MLALLWPINLAVETKLGLGCKLGLRACTLQSTWLRFDAQQALDKGQADKERGYVGYIGPLDTQKLRTGFKTVFAGIPLPTGADQSKVGLGCISECVSG